MTPMPETKRHILTFGRILFLVLFVASVVEVEICRGNDDTPARPKIVLADFEGPNYDGWTAEGNAFGTAPASAAEPGGMGIVFGHHGTKLVNTYVNPVTDQATGTLTSQEFTIERKFLTFYIGGGCFPGQTGIELKIDGRQVAVETGLFSSPGQGHEGLVMKYFDVSQYQGRQAQLVIFDRKPGGNWGHIKVDYICQEDEIIVPPANAVRACANVHPMEYNRMIFGQFIEHFHRQVYGGIFEPGSPLSDKNGFRTDVIAALRELKVPIVRWPGGCFVSSYHWLDGVGPDRQPAYDKAWHVEDPNTFGTAEFVQWCRLIGAEPYICTNAGTGTEEEMSDWVEYCNLNIGKFGRMRQKHGYPEPFGVRYWSIGNENWGGHEMGAKTTLQWGPFVRESAKLMLNTDPQIKLFAAALPDEGWTLPLLQTAGHLLNYVSIHGYWDWMTHHNNPSPYMACMIRTAAPENDILRTINILDRTGNRGRVGIAFDEWNLRGWHHPGHGSPVMDIPARDKNDINTTYTMADALFSACFLNSCLRHCKDVQIACFSPIVNTRGALFVHPKGLVKRTTFHVFQMYANELEKNFLPCEVWSERLTFEGATTPKIDAVLTCNDRRDRYVLAVVNKSPDGETVVKMDFNSLGYSIGNTVSDTIPNTIPDTLEAIVLQGGSPDDYNDIGFENRVVPQKITLPIKDGCVSLPAHSLTMITIPRSTEANNVENTVGNTAPEQE